MIAATSYEFGRGAARRIGVGREDIAAVTVTAGRVGRTDDGDRR